MSSLVSLSAFNDLRFDRRCDVDCGKAKAAKAAKAAKPAAKKTSKPKNLDLGVTKCQVCE